MDKLERLYAVHALFEGRRGALPLSEVARRLECSPATAKRAFREMRTQFNAPLIYDPALGGYRYARSDGEPRFELPGIWFGAEELAALLTLREVLARLEPGLLNDVLAPLSLRLDEILAHRRLGLTEAARRIRVLSQHARAPGPSFAVAARAVLSRRTLSFQYRRRTDDEITERLVSPQRLARYRGCWYLDAWCHDRKALRSFALERITEARLESDRARNVSDRDLDAHYADAYGIFAGPATRIAVLRVAPRRARWVADEAWHPRQTGTYRPDGSFELRVPYGRPEELVQDILRLGPDIEVLEPAALREEVAGRLRAASAVYGREGASAAGRVEKRGPSPSGGVRKG